MMDVFRKFGATKASKAMLILLIVSFGAWGIGGYLIPSIGAQALTVNGEAVSPTALEQTFNQRMENIAQLLGAKPTKEQIDQMQLPEQVITEVVARTVLRQQAEKLQFQASTQQLQQEIAMVSAFKNESGKFDPARYRQILQQIGRSPKQFEHDLSQDIIVRQLARLSKVDMPPQTLAAVGAGTENAHLVLDVATFTPADAKGLPTPTNAELTKFHSENAEVYSKPENRDLTILRLSKEDIAKSITVPEKDVLAAYNANKTAYTLPEQRVVRHILVSNEEEAKKLASTIKTPEEFAAAANASSKDPGNAGKGGLLGKIQEKDVVPAFGKVAFTLPVGQLSAPVQSNFGWHLIWVDEIEPAKSLAFDEVKDAIARDLQATQADEALVRIDGQVNEKIAAGEPLAKIAGEVGIKALQHNMVTATDEGVEPQELQTAFTLEKDEISVPITMKDGGNTYVQVTAITPAKIQPLAEVKDRVVKDWTNAAVQMQLRKNAEALAAAARAPGQKADFTTLLAQNKLGGTAAPVTITTPDEAPAWLQRQLLELYPLAAGTTMPLGFKDGENWHVVRFAAREKATPNAETLPEMAKVYQQRLQGDVEALLMNYLTQQAKVKINQTHIKQLFGREVVWNLPAIN